MEAITLRMTTMTVQIPTSQIGWFEQMIRAMGWIFKKEDSIAAEKDTPSKPDTELDELLAAFRTDEISQEEIDRECELVREELYHERQTR